MASRHWVGKPPFCFTVTAARLYLPTVPFVTAEALEPTSDDERAIRAKMRFKALLHRRAVLRVTGAGRHVEHEMRRPNAGYAKRMLHRDIGSRVAPRLFTAARGYETYGGFTCAPEIGASPVMSMNRIAVVASVLPSSAMASLPCDRLVAMILSRSRTRTG